MAGLQELIEVAAGLAEASGSQVELRERLAELELSIEDQGWTRLTTVLDREFSRAGLKRATKIARLMYLSNPLIRNAVNVQANYVWGQGVNVRAKAAVVNGVVQTFLDLPHNRREFTGQTARLLKEIELQLAGNLFLALFTQPSTGTVRTRSIDPEEIDDIVTNPDDSREPWYYRRVWSQATWNDETGAWASSSPQVAYHPDWLHPLLHATPRPAKIGEKDIVWDAPVYHLKGGALDTMRFGAPEIFAALDWARAVKQDLEDYATIRRALTRFAWTLTRKGGKQAVAAAKGKLESNIAAGNDMETNPPPVTGSTFVQSEGVQLQPLKTGGMAPSPDEGRRLWLMVSGGVGIPEAMISGDSAQGSWATAKSLDRPTELKMRNRQEMWRGTLRDILNYVIDEAVLAPNGPLKGRLVIDKYTGESHVEIGPRREPIDRRLDIDFPDILERDALARVQAIATATTLNGQTPAGVLRPETVTEMTLQALGQDNIDEELARMYPDDPDPAAPPPGAVTSETIHRDLGRIESLLERSGQFSNETMARFHQAIAAVADRPIVVENKLPEIPPHVPMKKQTKFITETRDGVKNVIVGKEEIEVPVETSPNGHGAK